METSLLMQIDGLSTSPTRFFLGRLVPRLRTNVTLPGTGTMNSSLLGSSNLWPGIPT